MLQVVGDDLLCTNPKRVQTAIEKKACNALLLKVNQIGSVTESIEAVRMSKVRCCSAVYLMMWHSDLHGGHYAFCHDSMCLANSGCPVAIHASSLLLDCIMSSSKHCDASKVVRCLSTCSR